MTPTRSRIVLISWNHIGICIAKTWESKKKNKKITKTLVRRHYDDWKCAKVYKRYIYIFVLAALLHLWILGCFVRKLEQIKNVRRAHWLAIRSFCGVADASKTDLKARSPNEFIAFKHIFQTRCAEKSRLGKGARGRGVSWGYRWGIRIARGLGGRISHATGHAACGQGHHAVLGWNLALL